MTGPGLVASATLAAIVGGCASNPTPKEHPPEAGEVRFLTYNVHGLLEFITGDDTPARMLGISPLLAEFDVAGIQENFFYSEQLMTEVEHPHVAHFDTVDEGRTTSSGLTIASRPAIEGSEGEAWRLCHGIAGNASDCLATKGLQWSRLRVGEAPYATIDVFNLHMEAGGSDKDIEARTSDVTQLLENIAGRSEGHAVVALGDFNLRPTDDEDVPLLERLVGEGGLTELCGVVGCPEPNHIDRFYVRDGERVALAPRDWRREEQFVDADGVNLSDHPALSARIAWSTR